MPFEPGEVDHIVFKLPDVQIQSSWFPLTDRNPQKFMEIPKGLSSDFVKATERVNIGGADGSRIQLLVVE